MNTRPTEHAEWNAGDMGCGELVLELLMRVRGLGKGQVLHLVARDPGAREDIPAWCRMTNHPLIEHEHPDYWIQRPGD